MGSTVVSTAPAGVPPTGRHRSPTTPNGAWTLLHPLFGETPNRATGTVALPFSNCIVPAYFSNSERVDAALSQARQRPFVLRDELVHHVAVLQFRRQHFPRVRLHLNVGAKARVRFQNVHHAEKVVGGRVEQDGRFAVQRNVEMDAPLVRRLTVDGHGLSEGDVQVLVASDGALRGAGDDLMEINV